MTAGVNERTTVTVIGDGAVGLCAVLAAKRLGAEQIILMGRHEMRTDLGLVFGATDIVAERGDEGIKRVRELNAHAATTSTGRKPPETALQYCVHKPVATRTTARFQTLWASIHP